MFVYQRESVNFALNRGGRIILGNVMGLGKTVQALGIALHYKLERPLLIIASVSLSENWAASSQQFPGIDPKVVRSRTDIGEKITAISHDVCSRFIDIDEVMKYGVITADECHYIKSATSKRTNNILPILQDASQLILMPGTPAASRLLELYTIISAVDKSLYPTIPEYGMRYCSGRKIKQWHDCKGCSNLEELNFISNKYFMLRSLKDEVLNQIPPKFR